ncbi:MAG: GNAT family N-acetyltransferase [Nakamurella sp.]
MSTNMTPADRPAAGLVDRTGSGISEGVIAQAERLAAEAATRSRVEVRTVADTGQQHLASDVLQRIWSHDGGSPLPPELLRAFDFTGNYVGAAYDGAQIVGVATAFLTDHRALHSHIAGVLPSHQGRSIGYVLKLHQRAWAMRHGIRTIAWTFDPLVRRNAHFNLIKLGAAVAEYLPDFYGELADGVNTGDRSDRLLAEWDLLAPVPGKSLNSARNVSWALIVGADGEPLVHRVTDDLRAVQVPPDVEAIRRADPALGRQWRAALRSVFADAFADGHRIIGLDRTDAYVTQKDKQKEQQ